jgi:hypothetical protein
MESSGQTPVLTPLGSQPPSTPIVTLPAVQWLQSTHPVLADAVSGLPVDITPLREILNQPNSSDASNALGAVLAALADHANSQQINLDVQRASLDATSRELADMKLQRLADENTARDLINQLTEAQSSLTASKSSCEEQGRQLQEAAQRLREAADVTDVLRQQLNVAQAQATEAINVAATLRQERDTLQHEGNALRQESNTLRLQLATSCPPAASSPMLRPQPRHPTPKSFNGAPGKRPLERQQEFQGWVTDVRSALAIDRDVWPTAAEKILFVFSVLDGEARNLVHGQVQLVLASINDPSAWPEDLRNVDDMVEKLSKVYVTIDGYAQATRDMESLFMEKPGKKLPFSVFLTKFTQLADDCHWSPARRVEGLKTKVSRDLTSKLVSVLNRPGNEDIDGWIATFRQLQNNIDDDAYRQRSLPNASPATDTTRGQQQGGGDPMDLGSIPGLPRGPLSQAEKDRRRLHNLCNYCGGAGHFRAACPALSQSQGRTTTGKDAPPA